MATGLVLNSNVTWVNPIEKVALAEHKLYQLRLAQQLGLAIPRSIVSRNPRRLREFISKSQFGAICKPIFHGLFFDESGQYSIYTRRVSADAFSGDTLEICPVFLQEEIPRQADVRITFIGSTFFTVDILGREGLVDWRAPDSEANFHVSTVSEAVISRCQLMLQTLGLRYGAFDFIRTPDGRLVFLEINPTGEWAWLEDILALPMRESFVRLLYDETP
ncbi:hypothetical protein [Reyranella sp.]|uniref:hypothetical protein n=1 Tax=Reyranella sp. TaxID=1929291 RepID=UPI003D1242AF